AGSGGQSQKTPARRPRNLPDPHKIHAYKACKRAGEIGGYM
ncbi:MAG: hypothetical protein AVDCRST_MAG58-2765, partial [uncultured Rubrobacteraceae bacterium]